MPTTRRGHRVGLALAVACVMGIVLVAFGTSGALAQKQEQTKKPAEKVKALVLGQASSPLLTELKLNQGWHLTRAANAQGRGNDPTKYDALVVDGDALSPEQLGSGTLVDEFADANRWVLALDTSPADYDRGIMDNTGFAPGARSGKSRMFLFSRKMLASSPRVVMIEAKSLRPLPFGNPAKRDPEELGRATAFQTEDVASTATRAVRDDRAALTREYAPPGASGLPSQLLHAGWTYSDLESLGPLVGHWDKEGCTGFPTFYCVPKPGTQTASWTLNHNIDVYLDNGDGHSQGNFQYVTYSLDGAVTPKQDRQEFFHMFDPFTVGVADKYQLERAFWTGRAGVAVRPLNAKTRENLVYQAARPATPNEETEYTYGEDFNVGFSISKEGPEFQADKTIKYEETNKIPDWGVQNNSSGNVLRWLFTARKPCDLRPEQLDVNACFNNTPKEPNQLSRGQLQLHTVGRWKTKKLLTDQEGQDNQFSLETPIEMIDTFCGGISFSRCVDRDLRTWQVDFNSPTAFHFDIGAVNPISVESITFSQNPANGTRREKVTGTVTLERPALRDTTVTIYSNSENATVGVPKPSGVSSTTITIPMGKTSSSFQVLTNDNRLSPGQHTTATFTAFYAKDYQEQLVVLAQKKGDLTP